MTTILIGSRHRWPAVCALISAVVFVSGAQGATWYVDVNTCPSVGNGSSSSPFCAIQSGIDAAANGDEIVVSPGLYVEAVDVGLKSITLRSESGPAVTTIDAAQATAGAVRCVGDGVVTPSIVVEGFTVKQGGSPGGGFHLEGCDATIRSCDIFGNSAAGILIHSGNLLLEDSDLHDNFKLYTSTDADDIEVCSTAGQTAVIRRTTINNNLSWPVAIYSCAGSQITLEDSTIVGGRAHFGGPIEAVRTNLVGCDLYDSGEHTVFRGCTVRDGGSVTFQNASVELYDSVFDAIGGSSAGAATWLAERCGFYRNRVGFWCGSSGTSCMIRNCEFVGNTAPRDGAFPDHPNSLFWGNFQFTNCTIVRNVSDSMVWDTSRSSGPFTLTNSIVWNNLPNDDLPGITVTYSNVGVPQPGEGNISEFPLFVRNPDPGKGGWVDLSVTPDYGDLRLLGGSPGIDAGSNTALAAESTTDFGGLPRRSDAPCTADTGEGMAPIVDMGAHEHVAEAGCGDGVCDGTESCATCPCDCGDCCGNGVCDSVDECAGCASDCSACCGDGVCSQFESCLTCPADCTCVTIHVPGDQPTIQDAINVAGNGDTVAIAPGVYEGGLVIAHKGLTLVGTGGADATVLDDTNANQRAIMIHAWGAPRMELRVEGVTLIGRSREWESGLHTNSITTRVVDSRFVNLFEGVSGYYNDLDIQRSQFMANATAINLTASVGDVSNCAFVGNSGVRSADGPDARYTSCTFVDTSVSAVTGSSATIANSIVYRSYGLPPGLGGTLVVDYSDVYGIDYPGVGNINAPPEFVRYPDDGGDGWGDRSSTRDVDEGLNDDYGDLHLASNSPCIDAGSNLEASADDLFDLGGDPRFGDDPAVADTGVGTPPVIDMGAYERQGAMVLGTSDLGNRYFTLTGLSSLTAHAIRVTPTDVNGFPEANGQTLWVGRPFFAPAEDSAHPGRTFVAAGLQCEPYYANWRGYDYIQVYGAEVLPSSEYDIAAEAFGGTPANPPGWPLTLHTGTWGDVVAPYAAWQTSSQPDFGDISAVVQKFLGDPIAPDKIRAQLQPNVVFPSRPVDFNDISAVVSAFVGISYSDSINAAGPCTCPSAVTCAATACSYDSECGGGYCINGTCTDACGRCSP